MSAQNFSKKRPAPGAEPVGYSQPMQQTMGAYNPALGPQLSNDEFLQWGSAPSLPQHMYQDPNYNMSNVPYNTGHVPTSNQLTRRPMNQLTNRSAVNANSQQWAPPDPNTTTVPDEANEGWDDDIEELEQKAQLAKRESTAKRKQIPPFVLKLRKFVDDGSADLIRWTDDGKSFVVLDEDEFAKTLIPELFKHNNYASFVRQLNMYGFHKRVGLSDNSMRASERKSKSPSEYSNPYFRRGHPDLMWLIQKPKNVSTATKGKGRIKSEDAPEDGDDVQEEVSTESHVRPKPQLALGDGSAAGALQETLQSVQRELQLIRHKQAQISQMMVSLKREHEQLYVQAVTFQDQHNRHENSINAILTFLATIYNRNIANGEGPHGTFNPPLPQDMSKSGTVVDVGDYNFGQFPDMDGLTTKPFKKPQLLLTNGQNRATTLSPAGSSGSPVMQNSRQTSQRPASTSPLVQEVFDGQLGNANQSAFERNSRTNGNQRNQQDMMSMIERANANNPSPRTPAAEFNDALNNLENSHSPLSNAQRAQMLQIMNNNAKQTGDNALVNSNPPTGPANFDRRLANTKSNLDALAKMQAQQDESVEKLANLLQPLSPSGSIPGINDGQSLPPAPFDVEDFLNSNDFFTQFPSDGNGHLDFANSHNPDGSFNWDAAADDDELFAGVDGNAGSNNDNFNYATNNNSGNNNNNPSGSYDDSTHFLNVGNDHRPHNGGGRVESVASSEVTTPKGSSSVGGDDDDGFLSSGAGTSNNNNNKKGKGRKLSVIEEPSDGKRRRKS